MGLFSWLFGSSPTNEAALEAQYVSIFREVLGLSSDEAKALFNHALTMVRAESIREGKRRIPPNFGDRLLGRETTDTEVATRFAEKRAEGVTDADIRWWWNMDDLERRLLVKVDETARIALFMKLTEGGMSAADAAKTIWKFHPKYGSREECSGEAPSDRPLPYELKNRVNSYIIKRTRANATEYKADLEASPSFNALIRRDTVAGKV